MKAFCVLVVLFVFGLVHGEQDEQLIEPKLRMIDNSPPIARAASHGRPFAHPDAGTVDPSYEEGVSFSVNTRGEYGSERAPLFCNCRVLSVLEEDPLERDEYGQPITRQSYTAPQLREHVPLVTPEYALTNDQISFGVNVRGEEGPEFAPTWCTCQILQTQHNNNDNENEPSGVHRPHPHTVVNLKSNPHQPHSEGSEKQQQPPQGIRPHFAGSHGPVRPAPHVTNQNIQMEEGVEMKTESLPLSPSELATQTMNLELSNGLSSESQSQISMSSKSTARRHRYTNGVTTTTATTTTTAAADKSQAVKGETHYSYRGRSFSQLGDKITEVHKSQPAVTLQMLSEIDEGTEPSPTSSPSPSQSPSQSPEPSQSPSPSPSSSPSPSPSDDDNDQDPISALRRIAMSHPHASALLAQALQTAAVQKQNEIDQLQASVHQRDEIIHQLTVQNERIQEQLKVLADMEEQRLMTPSPSPTPSQSPSPSSSPSPSATPVPSQIVVPPPHHAHHTRRSNGQACYHDCRDKICAPLFETSLHQFGTCMDQCAAKCYGGR